MSSVKNPSLEDIYDAAKEIGFSEESRINQELQVDFFHDYFLPISRETLEQKFHGLAEIWRQETECISSVPDMVLHPCYQQIIGMGPSVIPLLLAELEARPHHWFWALSAITGENPIKPAHRGNMSSMRMDWMEWGCRFGYLQ